MGRCGSELPTRSEFVWSPQRLVPLHVLLLVLHAVFLRLGRGQSGFGGATCARKATIASSSLPTNLMASSLSDLMRNKVGKPVTPKRSTRLFSDVFICATLMRLAKSTASARSVARITPLSLNMIYSLCALFVPLKPLVEVFVDGGLAALLAGPHNL